MSNRFKVAIVCICLNQRYWEYLPPMIQSARKFLLKGHDVDFICWTDMPTDTKIDAKIIPTESFEWPLPTLNRYHLFLKEEQLLSEYDYIYYVDADMKFVARVGDEILGDLVGAQHPMYAMRHGYIPPYETNPKSTAYVPLPGIISNKDNKERLEPKYLAGGLQGGRSDVFIKAMKSMKEMIDKDFMENNYIAKWNDESYWNKYCLDNKPTVVLNPSYVYPDSLIKQYYMKVWGRNYIPRLLTITKKFSLSQDGGKNLQQTLNNI